MIESIQHQAKRYLAAPKRSLWKWTPNADGVQWSTGQTITFVAEIKEVLRHQMAGRTKGLPPFGAVLLLIAATRDNWSNDANRHWRRDQLENLISLKSKKLLDQVIESLDRIHSLEPEVRATLAAKQTLADVVLEESQRTTTAVGIEVLKLLESGTFESFTSPQHRNIPDASTVLVDDFHTLKKGLLKLDEDQLLLRQETGVEEIPTAELIDIPDDADRASTDLFSELESDSELYVLGRAARQLYSVLSLPQPSFAESELQQGGVSDIANRGPLDRLLLSELAHDDLTLAVRVAVNEAMYLRRESPPQSQQRRQIIVLDSGLRSWGMPRLIGTAIGLALVARADDSVQRSVYCANKKQLDPVSLSNREDIAAHLKTLRPELDLTASLPGLDEMLSRDGSECDLVLVTNDATAESSSLATAINRSKLLTNANLSRLFVGSVAHDGETKLIEVNHLGRKLIKQLTFDSNRLTENSPTKEQKSTDVDSLPAFFGLEEMPLRLSYSNLRQESVWPIGPDALIVLTNDGRLLYYNDPKLGGRQVSERISPAKVWWYSTRPSNGVWSAVIGHDQRGDFRILNYDEDTEEVTERPLDIPDIPGRPVGFCSHQGTLFVIFRDQVAIVDQASGAVGNALEIATDSWKSGRFFAAANSREFYALSTGGYGYVPELEKIELSEKQYKIHPPSTSILHIHECENVEGPIIVNPILGEIHLLASEKLVTFQTDRTIRNLHKMSVVSFDPFSGNVCLKSSSAYRYLIVCVKTGVVKEQSYPENHVQQRIQHLAFRQHQLRRKFQTITVLPNGTLRLASRNQPRLEFAIGNNNIFLSEAAIWHGKLHKQSFQRVQRPAGMRYELQVARWDDGSEAWLDSRGLLHLRSSNVDIPELTITLSHGASAGWCSNGELFGPSFHIGKSATNLEPEEVLQIMKRFGEHVVKSC